MIDLTDDQVKEFLKLCGRSPPAHVISLSQHSGKKLIDGIFGATQRKDSKTEGRDLIKALNAALRRRVGIATSKGKDVFKIHPAGGVARTNHYLSIGNLMEVFYPSRASTSGVQASADPTQRPAAAAPPTRAPWWQAPSPAAGQPSREGADRSEEAANDAGAQPWSRASTVDGADDDSLDAGDGGSASAGDSGYATPAAAGALEREAAELAGGAPAPGGALAPGDLLTARLVAENNKLKEENRKLKEENHRLTARRRASEATDAEVGFRMQLAAEAGTEFEFPQEVIDYLKRLGDQPRLREYEAIKWERQISFHHPYDCANSEWPDDMTPIEIQHQSLKDQKRLCKHCVCISFDTSVEEKMLKDVLGGLGLEVKTMTLGWCKVGGRPFCSVAFRHVREAEALLVNRNIRTLLFDNRELKVSDIWPLVPKDGC